MKENISVCCPVDEVKLYLGGSLLCASGRYLSTISRVRMGLDGFEAVHLEAPMTTHPMCNRPSGRPLGTIRQLKMKLQFVHKSEYIEVCMTIRIAGRYEVR